VSFACFIGYMESDYLGNNPANVGVSSNSNTLRSRLFWVDVSNKVHFAVALDKAEQYIGGSAGGPSLTPPTNFTAAQLNAYGFAAAGGSAP
jgi:hypothetical protein